MSAHSTVNAVVGAIRAARCAGRTAATAHATSRQISGATMLHMSEGVTSNNSVVMNRPVIGTIATVLCRAHSRGLSERHTRNSGVDIRGKEADEHRSKTRRAHLRVPGVISQIV